MKRPIEKLYIELTSACNLNCSMCFRHSWFDEKIGTMSDETLQSLFRSLPELAGLKSVMFSGMGEPLVHPHTAKIVEQFAKAGIRTELLTNATLLTRARAKALVDSGLDTLWVSVDGFERSSYEKVHIGSRFDLIMNNLENFNQLRGDCKLGITFVIMDSNLHEIDRINDFADRLGVDIINLSYEIPGEPQEDADSLCAGQYPVGKQKRVITQPGRELLRDYCPFVAENGCFVKWNGDVVPCMQLLHSSYTYLFAEKRKVHSKSFGNILHQPLQEIWESNDYASFRKRVLDFAFSDCTYCMGCEDRLENLTDCMYNSFPTCGACLWAQGIARCP